VGSRQSDLEGPTVPSSLPGDLDAILGKAAREHYRYNDGRSSTCGPTAIFAARDLRYAPIIGMHELVSTAPHLDDDELVELVAAGVAEGYFRREDSGLIVTFAGHKRARVLAYGHGDGKALYFEDLSTGAISLADAVLLHVSDGFPRNYPVWFCELEIAFPNAHRSDLEAAIHDLRSKRFLKTEEELVTLRKLPFHIDDLELTPLVTSDGNRAAARLRNRPEVIALLSEGGSHTAPASAIPTHVTNIYGGTFGSLQVGDHSIAETTQTVNTNGPGREGTMTASEAASGIAASLADETQDTDDKDSIVDRLGALPITRGSSTSIFSDRFAKAFPGVRGYQVLRPPDATRRLERLFKAPLVLRSGPNEWFEPIWFWGRGDNGIDRFAVLAEDTVLIEQLEIVIDEIIAVNNGIYYQNFLYVKTKPATPSGLYDTSSMQQEVDFHGYASEECGLYRGRYVKREEYDDDAAVIDGELVDFDGEASFRVRYLTPFNFIIAAHNSPVNSIEFDRSGSKLLTAMLQGHATIEDLIATIEALPKRPPMSYEYS
jgi:hypothetical protein